MRREEATQNIYGKGETKRKNYHKKYHLWLDLISNGNRTEWSTIQRVIGRVIQIS